MKFEDIVDALHGLSEQDLRDLHVIVVGHIKNRRSIKTLQVKRTADVGDRFILQGIRPQSLNGQEVEIMDLKRTKARVKSVKTGLPLGIVPLSCLAPVQDRVTA